VRVAGASDDKFFMYFAGQLTGLREIGREFDGRHQNTVLHSINKIERMHRSDKALKSTIMRLMDSCAC
jgi:chromosomal replication initiation ATPase DnaA